MRSAKLELEPLRAYWRVRQGDPGAPQVVLSVPAEQLTYTWRSATPLPSMSAFVASPRQMRLQSPGSPRTPLKLRSKPQARDWYPCGGAAHASEQHATRAMAMMAADTDLFIPGSPSVGGRPWMLVPFSTRSASSARAIGKQRFAYGSQMK